MTAYSELISSERTLSLLKRLQRFPRGAWEMFTVAEAAAMLDTSERAVQAMVARGEIRGAVEMSHVSGRYRTAWTQHGEACSHLSAREIATAMSRSGSGGRAEIRSTPLPAVSTTGAAVNSALASAAPTLFGHFAVFDTWTRIDSVLEGMFMERITSGAFQTTMRENRSSMRILLNHGHDPSVGTQPIAAITALREDATGAYYEGELLDGVPPLVVSGLRRGQYGSSFRFEVTREELTQRPGPSKHNPSGLPERTITQVRVFEFGPVTFPAYSSATSGVRTGAAAPPVGAARRFQSREEWLRWLRRS